MNDFFPYYRPHMLLAQMWMHPDLVGKNCLQRPIQAGLSYIRETGICDIFACNVIFSRIPCSNTCFDCIFTNPNFFVYIELPKMNIQFSPSCFIILIFILSLRIHVSPTKCRYTRSASTYPPMELKQLKSLDFEFMYIFISIHLLFVSGLKSPPLGHTNGRLENGFKYLY